MPATFCHPPFPPAGGLVTNAIDFLTVCPMRPPPSLPNLTGHSLTGNRPVRRKKDLPAIS
jgi:hypothetical protein